MTGLNTSSQQPKRKLLRVLHLMASNFFGGPERQIIGHALTTDPAVATVAISSFQDGFDGASAFLTEAAKHRIETHSICLRSAYDRNSLRKLSELLTRGDFDLLVTHSYRANILGRRASRTTGIPHIAVRRGATRENLKVRFYHWLDRFALRSADAAVFVSESARNQVFRSRANSSAKSVVIPNAADFKEVLGETIIPVDIRGEFDFPSEAIIIGFAGRLSPEKDPLNLVHAIPLVLQHIPQARFVFYGDGPLRKDLELALDSEDTRTIACYAGFRDNLSSHLVSLDLLVNPARSEGMPNIVLEAMTAGIPVVATAVGGLLEMLRGHDGAEAGWLVKPRSANALADAVILALSDQDERKLRVERAREKAKTRYSFAAQSKQWLSLYSQVTGNTIEKQTSVIPAHSGNRAGTGGDRS